MRRIPRRKGEQNFQPARGRCVIGALPSPSKPPHQVLRVNSTLRRGGPPLDNSVVSKWFESSTHRLVAHNERVSVDHRTGTFQPW
jgi:hypothetical protein